LASELDVVVNDPAEIGKIVYIAAVLVDDGVASPNRKAL
jgi:hypothetical protein